jgi:hypothetical protein
MGMYSFCKLCLYKRKHKGQGRVSDLPNVQQAEVAQECAQQENRAQAQAPGTNVFDTWKM